MNEKLDVVKNLIFDLWSSLDLEEESVRDNFVCIFELFDEMMDFGYPQTTESKILQEYVFVYFNCLFILTNLLFN